MFLEQHICRFTALGKILCRLCSEEKRCSPPLLLIAVSGPCEVVAADCMGPPPVTNLGNCYILILGDFFTKYSEGAALPSIETALIAQVFLDKVIFRHGPPHRFLTDCGTNCRKLVEAIPVSILV